MSGESGRAPCTDKTGGAAAQLGTGDADGRGGTGRAVVDGADDEVDDVLPYTGNTERTAAPVGNGGEVEFVGHAWRADGDSVFVGDDDGVPSTKKTAQNPALVETEENVRAVQVAAVGSGHRSGDAGGTVVNGDR